MSHFRLQAAQEQVWLPRTWPNMGRNMDRNMARIMFSCQHGGYHALAPEGFWKVSPEDNLLVGQQGLEYFEMLR